MARIRFQNRWVEITDDQLQALASYGAGALVRDFQAQPPKQPKQSSRQPSGSPSPKDENPQEVAELANRAEAVEKMQKQRAYSKQ
jgi:hypothetical protein